MRTIIREFVYGGHLLSVGYSAIVLTYTLVLQAQIEFTLLLLPYLISQVIYSYNHIRERGQDQESNPERVSHIQKQIILPKILLGLYVIVLSFCLFTTNTQTLVLTASICIAGILYTDIFKELGSRHILGFKNFYTSLFGTLALFLVTNYHSIPNSIFSLLFTAFVLNRLLVNSIFFDIKDIESDKKRGLKTFAVELGKRNLLYALHLLNFGSAILLFFAVQFGGYSQIYLSFAFLCVYSGIYLSRSAFVDGVKLRNLSYYVVDGEYLFWPLIALFTKFYS